ncbi:hypothetical protein [Flavobacterium sp. F52]|uniref:hypothetical protein n=1 Tax=Flavobacterium sp. F52 TaxID=1202532 RepID=UPI000272FDD0|nr:hypothetical protein [Flavobacterium sp. F52]EJG02512.1 hypothetical protein FF52_04795 [Flavobacterium sp. F52]
MNALAPIVAASFFLLLYQGKDIADSGKQLLININVNVNASLYHTYLETDLKSRFAKEGLFGFKL